MPVSTPTLGIVPRASARAVRSACIWLVLIPLIGLAVVQLAPAARARGGWDALAGATPRVLAAALLQALAGLGLALLVYRAAPRVGLRLAAMIVFVVVALAATYGYVRLLTWIPFMLLLSLEAIDAIPPGVRDAVAVDRVRGWFGFRTITLPLILPLLLGGIVYRMTDGYGAPDDRRIVFAHVSLIWAIAAGNVLARGRR